MTDWLERFAREFREQNGLSDEELSTRVEPPETEAWMDTSQLHQVVWNLCANALDHSGARTIRLQAGILQDSETSYLDVIDTGAKRVPALHE